MGIKQVEKGATKWKILWLGLQYKVYLSLLSRIWMFLRTKLEHNLEATTIDGWVGLHVLVISRLVMSVEIVNLGHQHWAMEIIKANKR